MSDHPGHGADADATLLIFGLSSEISAQDVRTLVGRCAGSPALITDDAQIDLIAVPGSQRETFAVVHRLPGRLLAYRIADRINTRQPRGRRLQSWVPVMAWS